MAENSLCVTVSGAAFSLLFYENMRSRGDQMGFLLGNTLTYTFEKLTDSDHQVKTINIHVNIEAVLVCTLPDILDDSSGRINIEKLKEFIRDKGKRVIGWFRFRQNLNLIPSMRDKIIHKQFSAYFSELNHSKEELFVLCLLSSTIVNVRGTHKFNHVFLRKKRLFEPVPLRIINLGNDTSKPDGSDYKTTPMRSSSDDDVDPFTKLIQGLQLNFQSLTGVESVNAIQEAAEAYLNTMISQVCESDREVSELEKQVQELRMKLYRKRLINENLINGRSNTSDSSYKNQKDSTELFQKYNPSSSKDDRIGRSLEVELSTTIPLMSSKKLSTAVNLEKSLKVNNTHTIYGTEKKLQNVSSSSHTSDSPSSRKKRDMEQNITKRRISDPSRTPSLGMGKNSERSIIYENDFSEDEMPNSPQIPKPQMTDSLSQSMWSNVDEDECE